jgi:hypothetical protein
LVSREIRVPVDERGAFVIDIRLDLEERVSFEG